MNVPHILVLPQHVRCEVCIVFYVSPFQENFISLVRSHGNENVLLRLLDRYDFSGKSLFSIEIELFDSILLAIDGYLIGVRFLQHRHFNNSLLANMRDHRSRLVRTFGSNVI